MLQNPVDAWRVGWATLAHQNGSPYTGVKPSGQRNVNGESWVVTQPTNYAFFALRAVETGGAFGNFLAALDARTDRLSDSNRSGVHAWTSPESSPA